MKTLKKLLFLYLLIISTGAQAQVLVLIHGYLGQGGSWRAAGVTHVLDRAGWEDGGHLRIENQQVMNYRQSEPQKYDRSFYTLDTPSDAPVGLQAQFLATFLKAISKRHPGESINLAGFSAGGLVARMYMVNRKDDEPKIASLITISTPHLGTQLAELGKKLRQTPLSWFTPYIGAETFNRSGGLYHDLSPEEPGNMLYWLNRQPHPKATYVSIIHVGTSMLGGDFVVSTRSQNMNNVIALRGQVYSLPVKGGHALTFQDALLLVQLLKAQSQV